MIYTSYFANFRKFQGKVAISIARAQPAGSKLPERKLLAPSSSLLADWKEGKLNAEQYQLIYYEELLKNLPAVEDALCVYDNAEIVLICWEHSKSFCHRHLLQGFADLYCPQYGIYVKEL